MSVNLNVAWLLHDFIRKNFREMQRLKHELQESRKKAEEERIRREMESQNAEITDLTGSEPNSRDDSRPFCKGMNSFFLEIS